MDKTITLPPATSEKTHKKSKPKKNGYSESNYAGVSAISRNIQQVESLKKALTEATKQLTYNQEQLDKIKQQLATSQQENLAQKKQIDELNVAQTTNAQQLHTSKDNESKTIAQLNLSLAESQNQIRALNKHITDLTAEKAASAKAMATAKMSETEAITRLKTSLTESQNQVAALTKNVTDLTAEKAVSAKALATAKASETEAMNQLKTSLTESQNQAKELADKNTALIAEQQKVSKMFSETQQSLAEIQKKHDEREKQWLAASTKLAEQDKQLATLRSQKHDAASISEPQTQLERRSYALGTLWGQEVIGAMEKVKTDGLTVDIQQVNSGLADSLNGSFKIPQNKIMAELDAMNKQVLSRSGMADSSLPNDKDVQAFVKKPGTKRANMGYYYRVVKKGKGVIGKNDVVSIVVKESLSNGKVIKDMAKSGKVLTLPLSKFPPLFTTAISQVGNNGKLVMMVPPELAYGEQGSPPLIPPSATMLYEIVVQDVATLGNGK